MDGGNDRDPKGRLEHLASLRADPERRPHHRLSGGRAQEDHDPRLDHRDLRLEPRPASPNLARVGLFVQAALATAGPPEVLDGVGDVDAPAVDPSLVQRPLQKASGGPDEGLALKILLVARLLAHKHHPGVLPAFAEYGLRGVFPKVAGPA